MQCHRCPKNGRPDSSCLECRCAEYLDNDHRTVIPVDDIAKVQKAALAKSGGGLTFKNGTRRNVDDCLDVLDVLKKCHHTSLPFVKKLIMLFVAVGVNAPMLSSVLDGRTLTECAKGEGITKQAAHQKWSRLVARNEVLRNVPVKRRREDDAL